MHHQKIRISIKISSKIYVVVCCGTRMVSFTLLNTSVEIWICDHIWNNCHSFHNLADIIKCIFAKEKYWCVLLIKISFRYAASGSIEDQYTLIRVVVVITWNNNMKTIFSRYRNSHYKVNAVVRPSYLYKGNPCTGKMVSLYWTTSHTFSVLTSPNVGLESLYITVAWWRHQMETFSA